MTSWLWALGGAVLGGLLADARGALGGFALGWLCGRQHILQRELRALSARLEALAGGVPAAVDAEVPAHADAPHTAPPRPASVPVETTTASTAATARAELPPAADPWGPSPRAGTPATVWDDGAPGRLETALAPVQAACARAWARLVAFFNRQRDRQDRRRGALHRRRLRSVSPPNAAWSRSNCASPRSRSAASRWWPSAGTCADGVATGPWWCRAVVWACSTSRCSPPRGSMRWCRSASPSRCWWSWSRPRPRSQYCRTRRPSPRSGSRAGFSRRC